MGYGYLYQKEPKDTSLWLLVGQNCIVEIRELLRQNGEGLGMSTFRKGSFLFTYLKWWAVVQDGGWFWWLALCAFNRKLITACPYIIF